MTRTPLILLAVPFATAAARPVPITADSWGMLTPGMTRAAIEHAMGRDSQPDAAGGPEPARCDEFHPRRAPAGVIVMVENERLTRVAVTRRGLATDRGIRVGDPASKVRAAYRGARLRDEPHTYAAAPARYLTWVRDARRGIRYEIDAQNRVSRIHAGAAASIRYVEGCL